MQGTLLYIALALNLARSVLTFLKVVHAFSFLRESVDNKNIAYRMRHPRHHHLLHRHHHHLRDKRLQNLKRLHEALNTFFNQDSLNLCTKMSDVPYPQ